MQDSYRFPRSQSISSGDGAHKLDPVGGEFLIFAQFYEFAMHMILASGDMAVAQTLQVTNTVPVVLVIVPDPVGAGLVNSLSRPGDNATGFMQFEYSLTAKWPELLKEIALGVKRASVLRDASSNSGIGQFAVIQRVAPSVGVEVSPINLRDRDEIERGVAAFARSPDGGLIVTAGASSAANRDLVLMLAARHKLPAIYVKSLSTSTPSKADASD